MLINTSKFNVHTVKPLSSHTNADRSETANCKYDQHTIDLLHNMDILSVPNHCKISNTTICKISTQNYKTGERNAQTWFWPDQCNGQYRFTQTIVIGHITPACNTQHYQ